MSLRQMLLLFIVGIFSLPVWAEKPGQGLDAWIEVTPVTGEHYQIVISVESLQFHKDVHVLLVLSGTEKTGEQRFEWQGNIESGFTAELWQVTRAAAASHEDIKLTISYSQANGTLVHLQRGRPWPKAAEDLSERSSAREPSPSLHIIPLRAQ